MADIFTSSWFLWAIGITIGLPLMLIALTEWQHALKRRHSFLARPVAVLRNYLLPLGALLLLTVSEQFDYWWQVLPSVVIFGLGLALTVSPLTSAILGAIDSSRSGIASAVNNAVARVAGLLVIAALGTIVGGSLDLDGFHRAAIVTAVFLAIGGAVSWFGIRNPAASESPAEVR